MRRQIVTTAIILGCLFSMTPNRALASDKEDVIAEFFKFNTKILDAKRIEDLPKATPQDLLKIPEEIRPVFLSQAKSKALKSVYNVHVLELEGHYAMVEGSGMVTIDGKEQESQLLLTLRKLKDGWDVLDFKTTPLDIAPIETDQSPDLMASTKIMKFFNAPIGHFIIETLFTVKEDGTIYDIKSTSYPKSTDAESAASAAVKMASPLFTSSIKLKNPTGDCLNLPVIARLFLQTTRECSGNGSMTTLDFYNPDEHTELSTVKELAALNVDKHHYKKPSRATNEELLRTLKNLNLRGRFSKAVAYALEVYRRVESQNDKQLDESLEMALSCTNNLTRELLLLKDYESAERSAEARLKLAETRSPDPTLSRGLAELAEVYILMGKVDEANETVAKFLAELRAQAKEIESIELTRVKPDSEQEYLKQIITLKYGLDPEGTAKDKSDPDLKKQAANHLRVSNFLLIFEKSCNNISVAYLKKCEDQKFDAFTEETNRLKN